MLKQKMASLGANPQTSQNIQVAVRCRPLSEREKKLANLCVIDCNEKRKDITVFDKNSTVPNSKTYQFDKVFGPNSKQTEVYNQVVRPVVMEVIEGYNCTIFAYGQTGTGKTFTMEGDRTSGDEMLSWEDDPLVGIIPRSVNQLFTALSISNCEYSVKISFIELYNEEVSDLLSESTESECKLRIFDDANRKGSVLIPGLEEIVVKSKSEVYAILQKGAERRQKASTLMNSQSSRSHSIFTVTVLIKEKSIDGEEAIKVGKLNLVDLAGSENIERSGATGKRAAEAGKINKSLTTLGRVITALVEHRDHIPYRESNLTRLLQDSLGGRTKTTIIATISPSVCNIEETMSTLDYAHKAKSIRNKPEINQKLVKKALIKEYTEEIEKLKRELFSTREKNGIYMPADMYEERETKLEAQKEEIRENLQKINALNEEIDKLNELFQDTKHRLDEKTVDLIHTTKKLADTEITLNATKKECKETKHLLDEQVKTEEKLYNQATYLLKLGKETKQDCKGLHEKLLRVYTTMENNRVLTSDFSREIVETFQRMIASSNNHSDQNKNSLCEVCELVNEIGSKVSALKEDTTHQLSFFDEKQVNWLKSQKKAIQRDIETRLLNFYQNLFKKTNEHHEKNLGMMANIQLLCEDHRKAVINIHTKLNGTLDSIISAQEDFEVNFESQASEYLQSTKDQVTTITQSSVSELQILVSATKNVDNKLEKLNTITCELEQEVSETLGNFQVMIQKLMTKFSSKVKAINEQSAELRQDNELNKTKIQTLISQIKQNESDQLSHSSNQFESKVNAPVKAFIDTISDGLTESSELIEELGQVVCKDHDSLSVQFSENKKAHTKDNAELNEFVTIQLNDLDRDSKRLQANIDEYEKESIDFIVQGVIQPIEAETNLVMSMVEETVNMTTKTRDSLEQYANETEQVLQNNANVVLQFSEQYAEDKPTGKTPKSKAYNTDIDLIRTRPHQQLLDDFRQSLTISEPATAIATLSVKGTEHSNGPSPAGSTGNPSPKKSSSSTNSLSRFPSEARLHPSQSESKIDGLSQPVKRQFNATDKENYENNPTQMGKMVSKGIKAAPPSKKIFNEIKN